MNGKPKTITVRTRYGHWEVRVFGRRKGLAITPYLLPSGHTTRRCFTITHEQSGLRITGCVVGLDKARRLLIQVAKLADWTATASRLEHRKKLAREVTRLREAL